MKTRLISGRTPVPPELQDVIERGSTSVEPTPADQPVETLVRGADRVVFWAGAEDREVRDLAQRAAEATEDRADTLVFVTGPGGTVPAGLGPHERFEWPGDEDRLKMAFLTTA